MADEDIRITMENPVVSTDRLLPLFAFLVVGILLFSLAPSAIALSLDEVVANAQQGYEKTDDLKANFLQEVTLKSLRKTNREEGTFYFKKPRQMVWDYTLPKAKKMVINAKTVWLYIPADSVVYVQDAAEVFKTQAIVRFLSGWGKLADDFAITFARPDVADKDGNFLLKLVPHERDFGIGELFLTLDKQFQISQVNFTDSYGNATRLIFRSIKINNNLPEKFFSFIPPAGTEVYRNR
jgi:outer membrane lipoprotein carrier protein